MSTQNFETFRGLLRSAICTRTQAQFANESGISAVHLNRMLNADTINRPSKSTLHKIAAVAKNGITYQILKDALDKDDSSSISPEDKAEQVAKAVADFAPEFPDAAREMMRTLSEVVQEQPYPIIVNSLSDHMDALVAAAANKDSTSPVTPILSYDLGIPRPYPCKTHACASHYVRIDLSMADAYYTATSDMLLYFSEIPSRDGTKYVIQDASCAVSNIVELFGMPPAALEAHKDEDDDGEALEEALKDPFYIDIQEVEQFEEAPNVNPNDSPERRLLNALFGGKETRLPVVTDGIGFVLKETPPNLASFFLSHREALLSPYRSKVENFDEIASAMDTLGQTHEIQPFLDKLDEMHYTDDDVENDLGWPAAIAVIMSEETGFPFLYMKKSEDRSDKFPWLSKDSVIVLANNAAEKAGIQREAILMATCRYVRELGLKRFGDILFANLQTKFRNPRSYIVNDVSTDKEEDATKEKKDEDYCVCFEDNPHPEKDGLYAVKLKDGRRMSLVFLAKAHTWIRLHKEWSDLIDSYCPDPLPLPHSKD